MTRRSPEQYWFLDACENCLSQCDWNFFSIFLHIFHVPCHFLNLEVWNYEQSYYSLFFAKTCKLQSIFIVSNVFDSFTQNCCIHGNIRLLKYIFKGYFYEILHKILKYVKLKSFVAKIWILIICENKKILVPRRKVAGGNEYFLWHTKCETFGVEHCTACKCSLVG